MSKSDDRKVKSLNDIPMVFKNQNEVKLKSSKVSLKNEANTRVEKIEQNKRYALFSQKIILKSTDLKESSCVTQTIYKMDYNNEVNSQDEETSVEQPLKASSKTNPLDVTNCLNTLSEEEDWKESTQKDLKKPKRILSIIDAFFSFILIAPMTIGFWRGTWTLMDIYGDIFPGWLTFIVGVTVHTSFAILKNFLHARMMDLSKNKTCLKNYLCKSMQIFYTYVFGVACNMQWRGGWIIFNYFFLNDNWTLIGVTSGTLISLTIVRSIRNLIAVPSVVAVDQLSYVFRFPTRYRSNTRDWSLYLLDCAFSVGVVGTLVVFVWRGVWILVDIYLFPEDREYSAIGSLAIGYVIVTVTFSLQPLMRYVCARLQGLPRLIAADGFLLLSFLGTVNVWRGIWNVLDLWLVPDNPELSCWITHIGCFVFLVLLNCSNSILVRGIYIDAEEDDGKCVVFPCHYLRLFFKVEREKKEARRRNLLVASKDFRPRPDGNAKDAGNGALLPNSTTTTMLPTNPESLV